MSNLITITGTFLDPSKTPLAGTITITPHSRYIITKDTDTLYAGPKTFTLDETGTLNATMIATDGWQYQVTFNLHTTQGYKVPIENSIITPTKNDSLPELLELNLTPGPTDPIIVKETYQPGELSLTGAPIDPDDPGAILLPATNPLGANND